MEFESSIGAGRRVDIRTSITAFGRHHTLVCEVQRDGQPRHVRNAVLQLRDSVARMHADATPMLITPFLSEESRAICVDHDVGYLDLHGNAFFHVPGVLIDIGVPDRPAAEQRDLKSLFRPKAAHILRIMLRDPKRAWRVSDLAAASEASLGHVSNVRRALLSREWAREEAAKQVWSEHSFRTSAAFASFSAARWIAPYGRTGTDYFHADREGAERIGDVLRASTVARGTNVEVLILNDRNILQDATEPAPGVICTGPVQTYLDLSLAGERGAESADHLRRQVLKWRESGRAPGQVSARAPGGGSGRRTTDRRCGSLSDAATCPIREKPATDHRPIRRHSSRRHRACPAVLQNGHDRRPNARTGHQSRQYRCRVSPSDARDEGFCARRTGQEQGRVRCLLLRSQFSGRLRRVGRRVPSAAALGLR